ncbi:MAG TPA: alkaline phosphatase family protein [Verrucomicrobiae bacterium]|nr:alkaline phosphatase family protein [Verrucomicrobiae bacterium]
MGGGFAQNAQIPAEHSPFCGLEQAGCLYTFDSDQPFGQKAACPEAVTPAKGGGISEVKAILPLFVFIDACGWEIIKRDPFMAARAPNRKRLTSVFGYSSACVPSILSGRWPVEHRNWNYFVYDPQNSPFKSLRPFRWLPSAITRRRIFRRFLSRLVKRHLNFRGYFDLYNIPFEHISLFTFSEQKSPLKPGGMNRGPNIFDFLEERQIPYHVSDPALNETASMAALSADIRAERIDFAFQYWPGLDGLLHYVGNRSPEIGPKLRLYEKWIDELLAAANEHYSEVRLYVFSDHGMANCDEVLDLRSLVKALPLRFGADYAVVYDSTMARFWFFNDRARQLVTDCLSAVPAGRIVGDAELTSLGAFFEDRYFGELIFLVKEGVLIVPSDMGAKPIQGMHGYHPTDKHSYATLCTNQAEIPAEINAIPDIFRLMTRDALLAQDRNKKAPEFEAA